MLSRSCHRVRDHREERLEKKTHLAVQTEPTQKRLSKAQRAQKTGQIMSGLKKREVKRKRGGKRSVYMTEPQSRPRNLVSKRTLQDPKITRYENSQIKVRKYDKSAYGVIIIYFPCTLSFANNLVYAVSTLNGVLLDSKTVYVRVSKRLKRKAERLAGLAPGTVISVRSEPTVHDSEGYIAFY